MRFLSLIFLFLIYTGYLIIGGVIFHTTECPQEQEESKQKYELREAIINLKTRLDDSDRETLEKVLKRYVSTDFQDESDNMTTDCRRWDHVNSVFFSFTVVTTIGYGHLFPGTPEGKAACLVYALIGIPLNALLVGSLGNLFSSKLKKILLHFQNNNDFQEGSTTRDRTMLLVLETAGFTILFTGCLLLVPAAIFMHLENWDFGDSLYYTLITLTTIGFGDMVPDHTHIDSKAARWVYMAGVILWILIGMGYIIAVIEVISDTYRSSTKTVKKVLKVYKKTGTPALTDQLPEEEEFKTVEKEQTFIIHNVTS